MQVGTGSPSSAVGARAARLASTVLLAAVLAATCSVVAVAVPAGAAVANPTFTPEQKAAAVVRPAVVYLEAQWEGWVRDRDTGRLWDAKSVSLVTRCTGFAVSNDGFIVTAGRCLDPSVEGVALSFFNAIADRYVKAGMITQDQEPNVVADMIGKAEVYGPTIGEPVQPKVFVQRGVAKAGVTRSEAIPARVVSFQPVSKGDVGLVKIEKSNQPMVTLADSTDVQPGAEVLTMGYPAPTGNSDDATVEPTTRAGKIIAKRTDSGLPFFETSAVGTPSMLGGPVVNLNGDILGMVSHSRDTAPASAATPGATAGATAGSPGPSGQPAAGARAQPAASGQPAATGQPASLGQSDQPENMLTPSSAISQVLAKAGVQNTLGKIDKDFRGGLDDYLAGRYTASIEKFDQVLAAVPSQEQAQEYRQDAVSRRSTQGDPKSSGMSTKAIVAGAGLLLVILVGVIWLLLRRRPPRPPGSGPQPSTQPVAPATEPVPAKPRASHLTYCTNCGQGASPGTVACATCGKQFAGTA